VLPMNCSSTQFLEEYARTRAVLLRPPEVLGAAQSACSGEDRKADPSAIFRRLMELRSEEKGLERSFTLETHGDDHTAPAQKRVRTRCSTGEQSAPPQSVEQLLGSSVYAGAGSWYTSFLVQMAEVVQAVLSVVPVETPTCFPAEGMGVRHRGPIWWFVGRNTGSA
jgi:hypothetical protein